MKMISKSTRLLTPATHKLEFLDALSTLRNEIQEIWFSFIFNKVYDKNAHYNSYKNKAAEIISAILNDEPIVLDRKATNISGNLDADEIRHICDEDEGTTVYGFFIGYCPFIFFHNGV